VDLSKSNNMEKPNKANKDFVAIIVKKRLFGDSLMLKNSENGIGLSYGLKKATALDNYVASQAIVNSNSSRSRITGLNNYPKNSLIIQSTST